MAIYPFKKLNVSYHFLVSAGLLVLICLPLTWPVSLPVQFWIKQCLSYLLWIGLFYLCLNILVPRLLFRDKGGYFTLAVLATLIAVVMISLQLDKLLNLPALLSRIAEDHHHETYQGKAVGILSGIVITLTVMGLSIVVAIAQKIQTDRFREQALEKEKIHAELSFLKTQINPHFFFNVLNTMQHIVLAEFSYWGEQHREKIKQRMWAQS